METIIDLETLSSQAFFDDSFFLIPIDSTQEFNVMKPPSMGKLEPVINDASSEHK
ncbi:hypothetical protein BH23BAC3_BH23BAC3_33640 [soil metagenome]